MRPRVRRVVVPGAAAVVLLLLTLVVVQRVRPSALPWNRVTPLVAAAYLPEWNDTTAGSLTAATAHGVSELSPVWATVNRDGSLALESVPSGERAALRQKQPVRLVPTIQNISGSTWQGTMVADLLSDPTAAQRHVEAVVSAAVAGGWQGVDLDYETLPPTAGPVFTEYLRSLGRQLHAHGMVLSVDVPARTADTGSQDTLAYPYQVIGSIADEVRVMAYDYSYSTGPPGPVAPISWVQAVVRYAVARVPADKLMLGLAAYGYDWSGNSGADIGAAEAIHLAHQQGVTPTWNSRSAAHTFAYQQGGQRHTVWYEDARSVAAKQQVALDNGLRGVAIWRLGAEDPQTWTSVAAATERSAQ
jgi:spore germination protein